MDGLHLTYKTLVPSTVTITVGTESRYEIKPAGGNTYETKKKKKKKKKKRKIKTKMKKNSVDDIEISSGSTLVGESPSVIRKKECEELAEAIEKHGDIGQGYKEINHPFGDNVPDTDDIPVGDYV